MKRIYIHCPECYQRAEHNLTEIEQRLFEKQWMSED